MVRPFKMAVLLLSVQPLLDKPCFTPMTTQSHNCRVESVTAYLLAPFIILKMQIKKIHISRQPQILVRPLKIITKMIKAKNHIIAHFKSQISSYC